MIDTAEQQEWNSHDSIYAPSPSRMRSTHLTEQPAGQTAPGPTVALEPNLNVKRKIVRRPVSTLRRFSARTIAGLCRRRNIAVALVARNTATVAVIAAEWRDDHSAARRVHNQFEPTDVAPIGDARPRLEILTGMTDHQAASRTGPRHRHIERYRIDGARGLIGAKERRT